MRIGGFQVALFINQELTSTLPSDSNSSSNDSATVWAGNPILNNPMMFLLSVISTALIVVFPSCCERRRARAHARPYTYTHARMHANSHGCMHASTRARTHEQASTHARTHERTQRTHARTQTHAHARTRMNARTQRHTHARAAAPPKRCAHHAARGRVRPAAAAGAPRHCSPPFPANPEARSGSGLGLGGPEARRSGGPAARRPGGQAGRQVPWSPARRIRPEGGRGPHSSREMAPGTGPARQPTGPPTPRDCRGPAVVGEGRPRALRARVKDLVFSTAFRVRDFSLLGGVGGGGGGPGQRRPSP